VLMAVTALIQSLDQSLQQAVVAVLKITLLD
jgi:hypothetical protein